MLTNAIEKNNNGETALYYVDKEKAADLYQGARVTMPKMLVKDNGFIHSIRESGSPVKPKYDNVTESQQFKRWFGDWQNHPKSASKVVNADGTPKVVYHGTTADFTVFEPSMGSLGKGIYFSDSKDFANGYTYQNGKSIGRVMEAYIDMKKPYHVKYADNYNVEKLKSEGFDGIIHEGNGMYMVFSPNQVKSATDNIGTFGNTTPDIRFSRKDGAPATAKDVQQLQRRNESLKKQLAIAKQEIKLSGGHMIKPTVIDRLANRLSKEYSSSIDKSDLAAQITELYNYIGDGSNVSADDMQAAAMNVAYNILDKSSTRDNTKYEAGKPVREYLKDTNQW